MPCALDGGGCGKNSEVHGHGPIATQAKFLEQKQCVGHHDRRQLSQK